MKRNCVLVFQSSLSEKNSKWGRVERPSIKEKTIRSNFPLDMTNDMIAMASIWEERLRPPKCDKKDDPQVSATSFPHLITLTEKGKS